MRRTLEFNLRMAVTTGAAVLVGGAWAHVVPEPWIVWAGPLTAFVLLLGVAHTVRWANRPPP